MGQKQTKIPNSIALQLTKETKFSEHELSLWYKEFMRDHPTGSISKDDMKIVYNYIFPLHDGQIQKNFDQNYTDPRNELFEIVFKIFDHNDDGDISFIEFVKGIAIVSGGCYFEDRLRFAFKFFDEDKNKRIDAIEFEKILKSVDAIHEETENEYVGTQEEFDLRVRQLYEEFNKTNHDDGINLEEFLEGSKNTLDDSFRCAYDLFADEISPKRASFVQSKVVMESVRRRTESKV